jgi:hypothetical protein
MSLIDAITKPLENGAPDGVADDADMAAINAFSSRTLRPEDVYVLPMVMASPAMSGYALKMGDDSLMRFAADAKRGTPLHIMHERLNRSVGYSYAGFYDPASGEARAASYIVRGRTIDDGMGGKVSTNAEIADIQAGLRRDVSVGPTGPFVEYKCDVCGKDLLGGFYSDSEEEGCIHIPGMKYDGVFATATVHGAELCEHSLVDKGAIPGAQIGRPATGTGTIIQATARANSAPAPFGRLSFAAPLAAKAETLYRRNKISALTFREWMDEREIPLPTKFQSDPPPPAAQEIKSMNLPEVKARLRQLNLAAGLTSILPDGDALTADAFAQSIAAYVDGEVKRARTESLDAHPIIATFAAGGVKTVEDAQKLLAQAKDGVSFAETVQAELKKQAMRLFTDKGNVTKAEARYNASKHLPVADLVDIAKGWKEEADEKYGVGKDGTSRKSAPAATRFSVDATNEGQIEDRDITGEVLGGKYASTLKRLQTGRATRNGGSN